MESKLPLQQSNIVPFNIEETVTKMEVSICFGRYFETCILNIFPGPTLTGEEYEYIPNDSVVSM